MTDCLFCSIVKKEIPSKLVFENDLVLAFRDINPQAPHHILIIPKKHIAGLLETNSEDNLILAEMYQTAKSLIREFGIENSSRLVLNQGRQAGQSVMHLHMHLLGGRDLTWPPG